MKKLLVLATLVLGVSLGFGLAGCGSESSMSQPRPRGGSGSNGWHPLPAAPIRVDSGLSGVWTDKELIVSGVRSGPDGTFVESTDVAAAYNPTTSTWRRLPRPPKMDGYCRRDVAWTGKEMLVWGCDQVAFDPSTDRWRRLPRAPGGEGIVVWTGKEMIGWGGGCCGDAWSGGEAYRPAADTWRTLAPSPLAPEQRPVGAWTGRELILLVSGIDPASGKPWPARFARAAAYDPTTDTWRRIAPLPAAREGAGAVWDGREVLVVGGDRVGLAYDPKTNGWRRLSPMPSSRVDVTAIWSGTRLLVWGFRSHASARPAAPLVYDPKSDRWSALPRAPLRGVGQSVVWTGHRLLVLGGVIGTPSGTNIPPRHLTSGAAFTPAHERNPR
jgi:hypothetical protein